MTLGIILFAKDNKIIITSDKRVTEGTMALSTHGDLVEKIHKVTDHCGLTIAGDAGTATVVIEKFLKEIELENTKNKKEISVTEASEIFRKVAVSHYTDWFGEMKIADWVENIKRDVIPSFRILIAGYDPDVKGNLTKRKIIEISSYRRFAPVNCVINFSTIGITTIAQYLLYRFYVDDQEEQTVAGLGAFCIKETSSQDDNVGDEFQIAAFSTKEKFRFYDDNELEKVHNRCAELRTELQTSLYTTPKVKESEI